MQKTLKLNFKLEEPTHNGRIYLEHEFKLAIDKAMKKPILGFFNFSGNMKQPSLLDMMGRVVHYTISKEKEIWITVDIVAPHFNEEILEHCDITMASEAIQDEEGIVTDMAILHFYMGHQN